MKIALISDAFPPMRTSGAIQIRDLAREFVGQGHELVVMVPSSDLKEAWSLEQSGGVQVLRLRAPKAKGLSYLRRALAEFLMPFAMLRNLKHSPFGESRWDGVVWYSPSIFHGPLVKALKRKSDCRGYLIIRDIFPQWAADMDLMSRGLAYRLLEAVARHQYSVADIVGVQTSGNLCYFVDWRNRYPDRKLEVLPNWLGQKGSAPARIRIADTDLAGRKVFVYAGNMGVAQNIDIIVDLAERLRHREDVGFILVGRGSERARCQERARALELTNMAFFDEIDPDEIPSFFKQCDIGLVTLDPRHKTHNIPGKFISYMQNGLPTLASVNPGNDIADIIRTHGVGEVLEGSSPDDLAALAENLLDRVTQDPGVMQRCSGLFERRFAAKKIAQMVVRHFDNQQ